MAENITHNVINFYGIKQVSDAYYTSLPDESKYGYIWFVRKLNGETVVKSSIYFGTRLYAENNDTAEIDTIKEFHENLVNSFAGILKADGSFSEQPFGSDVTAESNPILSMEVANIVEIFKNFESAIMVNKEAIENIKTSIENLREECQILIDGDDILFVEPTI